ncbi:MAG: glycerate kinase [Mariprofundaceae bacterium]
MPDRYDARLRHFASLCEACFGVAVMGEPGAGAAGGLGFALQLLGGSYHAGASMMADALGLDAALEQTDLVFTGEGRTDAQSLRGKVVCEVARRASRCGVPVALVSGRLDIDDDDRWRVFDQMLAASPEFMPLEESMLSAPALIADAVERMLRIDNQESPHFFSGSCSSY